MVNLETQISAVIRLTIAPIDIKLPIDTRQRFRKYIPLEGDNVLNHLYLSIPSPYEDS